MPVVSPASGQRQGCRTGARPGKIKRMRITLQKAKSWGRPCRPGDKFPWEASGTADLKVVYRKQSAIKLWDTSGPQALFYLWHHHGSGCIFSAVHRFYHKQQITLVNLLTVTVHNPCDFELLVCRVEFRTTAVELLQRQWGKHLHGFHQT